MSSPVSDARKLIEAAGWAFARHGTHEIWHCPCKGHTFGLSTTGNTKLLPQYATKAVRRCARDNREGTP